MKRSSPLCRRTVTSGLFLLVSTFIGLHVFVAADATAQSQKFDDVDSYFRVVRALPDGSLLLHAEDGRAIGEEIEYMPEWQAYGWFTSNSRVEWDVEVASAGAYDVYLEWSVSDEESGKPYRFIAGEEELTGIVERTGGWLTYDIQNIGSVRLEPGTVTMTFRPDSEFAPEGALLDLRGIYLVPLEE